MANRNFEKVENLRNLAKIIPSFLISQFSEIAEVSDFSNWPFFEQKLFFSRFSRKWFTHIITVKNSEYVVKSGCFEKPLWQKGCQGVIFFEVKKRYKDSFVKLLLLCCLIRRILFIWNIAYLILREN